MNPALVTRAEHPEPVGRAWVPRPGTVRSVRREADDIVTIELAPDPASTARTRPGQFFMLWVVGVGEVPMSVAGIGDDGATVHTVQDVGAVSHALCALQPGDAIGVRGPYGTAWSLDALAAGTAAARPDLVIIAGGLGLAPLRPVVEQVARTRDRFGRVALLEGGRHPTRILYAAEHDAWRAAGIDVRTIVDGIDGPDGQPLAWAGPVGLVTELVRDAVVDAWNTYAMVCGPEIMMRNVGAALLAAGVPGPHIEVSLERNMACGVGLCGHCQLETHLLCRDGAVFAWPAVAEVLSVREL